MNKLVVGLTGRSGSGKSTYVRTILDYFGPRMVCLLTMDDYYKSRKKQQIDHLGYYNFDLPTSFKRKRFGRDLERLIQGKSVEIKEYVFNNEKGRQIKLIESAPIILVEGLFIFHYSEINRQLDLKILLDPGYKKCFNRRIHRDLHERNYSKTEIRHRYRNHAEKAYKEYIKPYKTSMDLILKNKKNVKADKSELILKIASLI